MSGWVVITGAGRGIGSAIADRFAQGGYSVLITEIPDRLQEAENVARSLGTRYGCATRFVPLDLTNLKQVLECVAQIREEVKAPAVVVNNAGINRLTPALEVTEEMWDQVMNVNLKGTFFFTRELAKLMLEEGKGSIVMVGSQHGVVANENRAAYCASKAGLLHLTRALSLEWAVHGLRVNAVSPTYVKTDGNSELLKSPFFRRNHLTAIPLRAYASPADVASAVFFLASKEASMITGHNLLVDGGYTVK